MYSEKGCGGASSFTRNPVITSRRELYRVVGCPEYALSCTSSGPAFLIAKYHCLGDEIRKPPAQERRMPKSCIMPQSTTTYLQRFKNYVGSCANKSPHSPPVHQIIAPHRPVRLPAAPGLHAEREFTLLRLRTMVPFDEGGGRDCETCCNTVLHDLEICLV